MLRGFNLLNNPLQYCNITTASKKYYGVGNPSSPNLNLNTQTSSSIVINPSQSSRTAAADQQTYLFHERVAGDIISIDGEVW